MVSMLQRNVTTSLIFLGDHPILEKSFEKLELDWGSADSRGINDLRSISSGFCGACTASGASVWNVRKIWT